jgi:hypothetical protein
MKIFKGTVNGADMDERTITLKVDCTYDEMRGITIGVGGMIRIGNDMPKPSKSPLRHTIGCDRGEQELWDGDPNCEHNIVDAPGGGRKCTKCGGWMCL